MQLKIDGGKEVCTISKRPSINELKNKLKKIKKINEKVNAVNGTKSVARKFKRHVPRVF